MEITTEFLFYYFFFKKSCAKILKAFRENQLKHFEIKCVQRIDDNYFFSKFKLYDKRNQYIKRETFKLQRT